MTGRTAAVVVVWLVAVWFVAVDASEAMAKKRSKDASFRMYKWVGKRCRLPKKYRKKARYTRHFRHIRKGAKRRRRLVTRLARRRGSRQGVGSRVESKVSPHHLEWRAALSDPAPYTVRIAQVPQTLRRYSFGKAKYGLVISLDGVSYDMMRRYGAELPTFQGLIKHGFLRPSISGFPSVTWISHVSIATGQYARHHGVLGNRWLEHFRSLIYPFGDDLVERERRKRTPNLYDLTAKQKWITAALNWPATQDANNITYNLPEFMYSINLTYRYLSKALKRLIWKNFIRTHRNRNMWSEEFFKHFLGRLTASEKIETDMFVRDLAVQLVSPQKGRRSRKEIPRLMLLHFLTPDTWLHKYGTSPWVIRWSLEQMDRMVGEVIAAYKRAGIWQQTATFVTSDHGFVDAKYTLAIRQLLIREGISRYRRMTPRNRRREKVMTFLNGHAAYIYVRPEDQKQFLPRIVRTLREPQWKRCVDAVYTPEAFAKLGLPYPLHQADYAAKKRKKKSRSKNQNEANTHQGSPTLIAMSKPDCIFLRTHSDSEILKEIKKPWKRFGVHGYLPNYKPIWAFLIGHGPGIRARRKISKRSFGVDIAPTIAHLLGLRWPKRWPGFGDEPFKLDGRILQDILIRR